MFECLIPHPTLYGGWGLLLIFLQLIQILLQLYNMYLLLVMKSSSSITLYSQKTRKGQNFQSQLRFSKFLNFHQFCHFLTSRVFRKFCIDNMMAFKVCKNFSWIRALQRTSNRDHTMLEGETTSHKMWKGQDFVFVSQLRLSKCLTYHEFLLNLLTSGGSKIFHSWYYVVQSI